MGVDFDDDFDGACERCGGRGYYVNCIDDMCGPDECIHGDGYRTCPCQLRAPTPASPAVVHKEK